MSQALSYMLSGVAVFGVCLYGLILDAHLLRKVLAVNVMGTGVFLLLVGVARRDPSQTPSLTPWSSPASWWR